MAGRGDSETPAAIPRRVIHRLQVPTRSLRPRSKRSTSPNTGKPFPSQARDRRDPGQVPGERASKFRHATPRASASAGRPPAPPPRPRPSQQRDVTTPSIDAKEDSLAGLAG